MFIKNIISRVLYRRHSWHHANFSELSELYTTSLLRNIGISLIGVFVPIYLYKLGYSLPIIFLFLAGFFFFRLAFDILAGYLVALKGPKHIIRYSYVIQVVYMLLLLSLSTFFWPLWLIAAAGGAASSFYFVAYHVDFSKVMHSDHGGKELGFMTIIERIGGALGPVIGGVVASLFGARYTIAAATILLVLAAVPLFLSAEPTKTHQAFRLKDLRISGIKLDLWSYVALGAENAISLALWPLFIAVTILTVNTYAAVGLVTSVGVVTAIFSSRLIGRLVDRRRGGELLTASTISNAGLHLIRPFITGFGGILVTNVANETMTTGYRLPYTKGFYAQADDLPGQRIAYIVSMEAISELGKGFAFMFIWLMSFFVGDILSMKLGFFLAAIASILIMLQRFPALRRSISFAETI